MCHTKCAGQQWVARHFFDFAAVKKNAIELAVIYRKSLCNIYFVNDVCTMMGRLLRQPSFLCDSMRNSNSKCAHAFMQVWSVKKKWLGQNPNCLTACFGFVEYVESLSGKQGCTD